MKKHGALEEQQEADGPVVQTVWKREQQEAEETRP